VIFSDRITESTLVHKWVKQTGKREH